MNRVQMLKMLQEKRNARHAWYRIGCWTAIVGGQCAALQFKVDGQQKSLLGANDRDVSSGASELELFGGSASTFTRALIFTTSRPKCCTVLVIHFHSTQEIIVITAAALTHKSFPHFDIHEPHGYHGALQTYDAAHSFLYLPIRLRPLCYHALLVHFGL